MRIYAIGDVHGCLDELNTLLNLIDDDLAARSIKNHRIILLGDYVDRGPNCSGVIERLMELTSTNTNMTCLFGNHDEKLLLATKKMNLAVMDNYFRYGGGETLKSYGFSEQEISLISHGDFTDKVASTLANKVKEMVPEAHVEFLRALPRFTQEGDYYFCHAGVQPELELSAQRENDLIWIREPFLSWDKPLEKVIIHGHTKIDEPETRLNRINLDTGCCYGGKLTAVVLEKTDHHFISTPAKRDYW